MHNKDRNISSMVKICVLSIAVTSMAFTLICCIMQGFQTATIKKLQSIHPEIIMSASGQPLAYDAIESIALSEFRNSLAAISPVAQQHIIIPSDERTGSPLVMMLQAIDAQKEMKIIGIMHTVNTNSSDCSPFSCESVVIGKKCAELLGKRIGDSIEFLVAKTGHADNRSIEFAPAHARISGFFSTGIEEYDMAFMLCSFDFFNTLFPESGITQCHIQALPGQDIHQLAKQLSYRFKMSAVSWQDLYPALLSTLSMQNRVTFLILALVLLVASTNLVSLLTMYAFYKRRERGLLILLRASRKQIRMTFFILGLLVGCFAATLGTALGVLAAFLLNTVIRIPLPDVYYVSHLPVNLSANTIALCWLCSITTLTALSWITAHHAASFDAGSLLKGE